MPGRSFNRDTYRYGGSNGQEKEDEIFEGAYTAQFWEYDSRLGRRWNVDPITKEWESPYATFANNPILMIDINGADAGTKKVDNGDGTGKSTITTTIYMVQGSDIDDEQMQDYVDNYAARIKAAYNGRTFTENGTVYTVEVKINVVIALTVEQAHDMIQVAGGVGSSNVLTVGSDLRCLGGI